MNPHEYSKKRKSSEPLPIERYESYKDINVPTVVHLTEKHKWKGLGQHGAQVTADPNVCESCRVSPTKKEAKEKKQ